ncbi:MAG: cell division protein FtsQ [SAR86 cluster bacterium]|uniref:Cell division protein FtsQ n=1 Tax=SAR86 cluster bacterium TaxID=2030880 RepID=A0A2A5B0L1_9GAMM|nr:MAG: cell division protein FtsQ [SAR86 cluster bacterium]
MVTVNRAIKTGNGIHAIRRPQLSGNQPLKPKYSPRRSIILLLVFSCSLILLVVQNQMQLSAFLNRPVSKVRIENQWQQISDDEVQTLLSGFMGNGFFDFDVDRVREELELHPWVLQASVKRIWPDTLSLKLTEQVAIAQWGDAQLLNQYGETFQPPNIAGLQTLPKLSGPENYQREVMEQYQKLSQILFPSGLRLSGLSLSKRGSWELMLNDEMQVVAGRRNVSEKTQRFAEFYRSLPVSESSRFRSIDLRYGNGIAVKSVEANLTGVAIR